MPMTSAFQLRYSSDSARVENAGPSITIIVPPLCASAPEGFVASNRMALSCGQNGASNAMCATIPRPKNVEARIPFVRSMS